ncbi:MAG: hypothetical protein CO093_02095 [Alphaproteobacteria bacterium CG_4_9_14_3_um_filter_47_13]|nr:MAG: hypothetical protein CO093_02095 [Alphaproteobacteria bacterium CG_4_9_14_3_um_filter_47_13]
MNHTKDHKGGGCCGGDKHHDHSPAKKEVEKEKDGCCDTKDKKPETDKSEKQGGCCGGKK